MVSKHKYGWVLPDPGLVFLLGGALGECWAGFSREFGILILSVLAEVGNSLPRVEAGLGS